MPGNSQSWSALTTLQALGLEPQTSYKPSAIGRVGCRKSWPAKYLMLSGYRIQRVFADR